MRSLLLALLAAAVLAAGCSSPAAKDRQTPDSSGQGIAPGEPAPGGGGPNGGMLIRPAHAENETAGLQLAGDESASGFAPGGSVQFTFNATNVGADATTRGACEVPYSFALRDENGTEHALDVPMMHCMALSQDAFPHGASVLFDRTWNGTYAEGDHLVQAPAGHYTMTATFTADRAGQQVQVEVTLPVNLIDQRGQL